MKLRVGENIKNILDFNSIFVNIYARDNMR